MNNTPKVVISYDHDHEINDVHLHIDEDVYWMMGFDHDEYEKAVVFGARLAKALGIEIVFE